MDKIIYNLKQFLIVNQETKKISHTKFWSNIGYGTLVGSFIWAVLKNATIDPLLWVLFGSVVVGNHTMDKILKYHFKVKNGVPSSVDKEEDNDEVMIEPTNEIKDIDISDIDEFDIDDNSLEMGPRVITKEEDLD